MKRSIINQYHQLEERYTGLVNQMNYRFMNLCIKAEEASLLPVKVQVEGKTMNLEEVATLAKKNDYEFVIVPNYTDDMDRVAKSIAMIHPEFKQSIDKLTVESVNLKLEKVEKEVPYILLTMPEVNDDRHDFMKQTAQTMYDDCKTRMEAEKAQATANLTPLLADEPEADDIRQYFDKLSEDWETRRDEMHEKKLQEIEEAYQKWLGEFAQQEIAKMEEEDAHSNKAAMSMKMTDNN